MYVNSSLCGESSRNEKGTRSGQNESLKAVRNRYLSLQNPEFLRSFISKFCCILIVCLYLHLLYFLCYLIESFITNFQLFGPKRTVPIYHTFNAFSNCGSKNVPSSAYCFSVFFIFHFSSYHFPNELEFNWINVYPLP